MASVPECIDPGIFALGKTIATTFVDLLTRPEELERPQAEFRERTGGRRRPLVAADADPLGLQASGRPPLA